MRFLFLIKRGKGGDMPMDFLQTLVKDAATIFLTTFAAGIAMRFANLPLKKKRKTTPCRPKQKGGSSSKR